MPNIFILIVIISLIPFIIYNTRKVLKAVHMLQQNSYNFKRFIRWINGHLNIVLPLYEIIALVILGILAITLKEKYYVVGAFGLVYFLLIFTFKKKDTKKPLVYTARVKRLLITITLLYLLGMYFSIDQDLRIEFSATTFYGKITLLTILSYLVVILANFINYPIERLVYYRYIYEAKMKIKKFKNLKVIGITGSYGKTSSKNILNTILNSKLYTLPTPASYNTPMGLTRTIRGELKPIHEVFIAEMGAYKVGDIKELCDLVKPEYAIITSIGPQHLQTFGSVENVQKGKFELVESLPSYGVAALNKDDQYMRSYQIKNNCKVKWYGLEHSDVDVYGYDVKVSHKGTSFKVKIKGDTNEYEFETKLLGKHNVYNILASITIGLELGLSMNELKQGVKYVETVEHRLQLRRNGDLVYIDDAFNSNPVGSKEALNVLKEMPGYKVIVTPGMIELGEKQYELNKQFGKYIADVCDYTILVGPKQTEPIQEGLKEVNYPKDKLYIARNLNDAFKKVNEIKNGVTYVLLENDLPDSYNE